MSSAPCCAISCAARSASASSSVHTQTTVPPRRAPSAKYFASCAGTPLPETSGSMPPAVSISSRSNPASSSARTSPRAWCGSFIKASTTIAITASFEAVPEQTAFPLDGPVPCAVDGFAPARHQRLCCRAIDARLEAALGLPVLGKGFARFPQVHREAGKVGGAKGRRLENSRPHHRRAEQIGLELHEQVVRRGAAIHAQLRELLAGVLLHRLEHLGALVGDRLERCARYMGSRRSPGQTNQRATGVRIPVRRTEAGKGWHEEHVAGIDDLGGKLFDLGRGGKKLELVPQPLHYCPGDEHAAVAA